MLTRFEVGNYKGFENRIVWDLTQTRDYSYNKNLISSKIVKHSIIFGKNGSGKSSLCTALIDITSHLLDVQKQQTPEYLFTYIGGKTPLARFRYDFLFGKKKVVYVYIKDCNGNLCCESLGVNNKEVLYRDIFEPEKNHIELPGAKNLRINELPKHLSILKFVYFNTIQDETSILSQLYKFVSGMLYFRSLRETNQYAGYKFGVEKLDDIILRNNKLDDFNIFLSKMDLQYNLVPLKLTSENVVIGAKFDNGKVIPLNEISSSGTKTLMLFFCWLLEFSKLTFLIIDEFDAYYHFEISERILKLINSYDNMQSVVTSHNVTLLNTDQTRPDCAFIIDNTGVRNLSSRTTKEIRKNHNIEKLYREGEFN